MHLTSAIRNAQFSVTRITVAQFTVAYLTVADFTDPTKKLLPNFPVAQFTVAQFWVAYFTVAQFTANQIRICYRICNESQRHETRIILNISYSCKSIAMNFSVWFPNAYIICHLALVVSTLYPTLHKIETRHWQAEAEIHWHMGPCISQGIIDETSGEHGCMHV